MSQKTCTAAWSQAGVFKLGVSISGPLWNCIEVVSVTKAIQGLHRGYVSPVTAALVTSLGHPHCPCHEHVSGQVCLIVLCVSQSEYPGIERQVPRCQSLTASPLEWSSSTSAIGCQSNILRMLQRCGACGKEGIPGELGPGVPCRMLLSTRVPQSGV